MEQGTAKHSTEQRNVCKRVRKAALVVSEGRVDRGNNLLCEHLEFRSCWPLNLSHAGAHASVNRLVLKHPL